MESIILWFNSNSGLLTGLGVAVALLGIVAAIVIYQLQKRQQSAKTMPRTILKDNISFGNGGDGIYIEGMEGVELKNNTTANNKGSGINIKD